MRFIREAWVLLSRGAGDMICCEAEVEPVGAVFSLDVGGEKKLGVCTVLARATGDRLRWEAWMVFIWVTGAILTEGAVFSCGAGGGEVTSEEIFS